MRPSDKCTTALFHRHRLLAKTIDKLYKPCLKIYPANGTCLIAFANEVGHQVMFTRGELLGIFLVRTNSSNLKKKKLHSQIPNNAVTCKGKEWRH